MIGLFSTFECQVVEKQFAPGDTLIMYSDGITEAENMDGEEFGEVRLLEIASRHRNLPRALLLEKITEGAKLFSYEQADDITLIVARCHAY